MTKWETTKAIAATLMGAWAMYLAVKYFDKPEQYPWAVQYAWIGWGWLFVADALKQAAKNRKINAELQEQLVSQHNRIHELERKTGGWNGFAGLVLALLVLGGCADRQATAPATAPPCGLTKRAGELPLRQGLYLSQDQIVAHARIDTLGFRTAGDSIQLWAFGYDAQGIRFNVPLTRDPGFVKYTFRDGMLRAEGFTAQLVFKDSVSFVMQYGTSSTDQLAYFAVKRVGEWPPVALGVIPPKRPRCPE